MKPVMSPGGLFLPGSDAGRLWVWAGSAWEAGNDPGSRGLQGPAAAAGAQHCARQEAAPRRGTRPGPAPDPPADVQPRAGASPAGRRHLNSGREQRILEGELGAGSPSGPRTAIGARSRKASSLPVSFAKKCGEPQGAAGLPDSGRFRRRGPQELPSPQP